MNEDEKNRIKFRNICFKKKSNVSFQIIKTLKALQDLDISLDILVVSDQ